MSYAGISYAGGGYAGEAVAGGSGDALPALAVEVAFLTDALDPDPAWVDITGDVRAWDTTRGRNRELERFQPGRATVVLDNRLGQYDSSAGLPAQYIDLPGTSGNYASTPDSAAVSITGDIDIRVRVAADDWTPAAFQTAMAKYLTTSNQRSYLLGINTTGVLTLFTSANGSTALSANSTAATGFTDGTTHWIRVTFDIDDGAGNRIYRFYTSNDTTNDPDEVTWSQLGSTVTTAGTTSIFDGPTSLEVGSINNGTTFVLAGNVYYADARNGIDGQVAAKFDANTVPQTATRQPSSWTSETGEVWTINGSAWAWGGTWGSIWYPNIRPMRRMRIRETFDGVTYPVFDGFVDRWQLDYPQYGKDATSTITATDAFKIFARTDLGRSVYTVEVDADAPHIWWRFDETLGQFYAGSALNAGTAGAALDATFVATPVLGGAGLIVNDPGTSMAVVSDEVDDVPLMGTTLANASFSLLSQSVFSVECWMRWDPGAGLNADLWTVGRSADSLVHAVCAVSALSGVGEVSFLVLDSTLANIYGVQSPTGGISPSEVHHVVCVVETGGQMAIWLDGVRYTTAVAGTAGTSLSGVTLPTNGDLQVGHAVDSTPDPTVNWLGLISEFAVYTSQLSDARVAAHLDAGIAPWNGDLPGARSIRILDSVEWPDGLRELDTCATSLQSATLDTTALEHLQKLSETEFGLLFVDRAGNVRLVSRSAVFARTAANGAIFGDDASEIAYRDIKFDDGDTVIRNRAKISQLNGVPATDEDTASVSEFGRFDYALDGLYHDSLTHSTNYADFIVGEYKDPRRRVISLTLGPAQLGDEADFYPGVLGRELGDAIVVRNRPPGGGATFEQTAVIEGIRHSAVPARGGNRGHQTTTFILSPDFTESF